MAESKFFDANDFDIDPNIIAKVSYIQFRPWCSVLTVPISLSKKREMPIIPIRDSLSLFLSLVLQRDELKLIASNVAAVQIATHATTKTQL